MSVTLRSSIPEVPVKTFEAAASDNRISTVLGLLPTSLRSRLVPFGRVRRSVSLGNISMLEPPFAVSPTPKSRPVSSGTTLVSDGDLAERYMGDEGMHSDLSACSSTLEEPSGINWRYAHQGIGLTGIAADARREDESESFERKAYVDGVTYLLRGLPTDLDEYEADLIRSALPSRCAAQEVVLSRSGVATPMPGSGLPKSLVHRLVQMIVLNLFLLMHFLLPYIITIFKSAAKVERKYKISETIVGHGMDCFNAAGRHFGRVAEVVLSDGRPEQGASGTFSWAVEEITRGISDGVGEGLVVTRHRDYGERRTSSYS